MEEIIHRLPSFSNLGLVGESVGGRDGDGEDDGSDCCAVGTIVGTDVWTIVGTDVGTIVGTDVGTIVGTDVGTIVGAMEGMSDGGVEW